MAKAASLAHYVALLWAATVLSVLLIASRTKVISPKFVLGQYDGNKVDWGKVKNTGKWSKEGLLAGSKMWGIASEPTQHSKSVLSTTTARESISDYFDHLEVVPLFSHRNAVCPPRHRAPRHGLTAVASICGAILDLLLPQDARQHALSARRKVAPPQAHRETAAAHHRSVSSPIHNPHTHRCHRPSLPHDEIQKKLLTT